MSETLLDTNVVSELMRPEPDANVARFVAGLARPLISAALFHELSYGVHLLPDGARKMRMMRQIDAFRLRFMSCTVAIDAELAAFSGRLRAEVQSRGGELEPLDALIGASALSVSAVLATRNIKHFQKLELDLVNPWTD